MSSPETKVASRRGFLRGGAASALAGSAPVMTAAIGAAFAAAFAEWKGLQAQHGGALDRLTEARRRCIEPPIPGFRFAIDRGKHFAGPVTDGKRYVFCDPSDENVEGLREIIARTVPDGDIFERHHNEKEVGYAKATLAKIEAYRAERDKVLDAAGIPALLDATVKAGTDLDEKGAEILAITPTTLREWGMSARVAMDLGHDAEEFLHRIIAAAGADA